MIVVLAHGGHDHGPNAALIALIVAVVVLGIVVAGGFVRNLHRRRTRHASPSSLLK